MTKGFGNPIWNIIATLVTSNAQDGKIDITATEEQNLRAFKSGASYCRSLLHTALGSNQVKQGDWISAGVNYYYVLFHLGFAAIVLRHEYKFQADSEFLWSDEKPPGIRRLWSGGHRDLPEKLKTIKEVSFCQELAKAINDAIDLREGFAYGPWFVVERKVPAVARPIYRRDESAKGGPFTSTRDLVTATAQSAESLLNQYPSYLNDWLDQWERSLRIPLRASFLSALAVAPWRWGLLPPSCNNDALVKGITNLVQVLEPRRAAEVMKEFGVIQYEEKRVKAITMTFKRNCPFCSSVIPADTRRCPHCGLDIA